MAQEELKKVKLGLIGHQAPGFLDFHPHPFLMYEKFGCIMQHISLADFLEVCDCIPNEEIENDIKLTLKKGWIKKNDGKYSKEDLKKTSKIYLGMKKITQNEKLDGFAIRCWPELPRDHGIWPLMGLARLASEGLPIACEGDVDGCLGCIFAKFIGAGVIYLSDVLEYNEDTLTLWHGGMAPEQLSEDIGSPLGPCIARHFNNSKPGILDAVIKIGIPVTMFRLWVRNKKYYLASIEGKTIDPQRDDGTYLMGNSGKIFFTKKQLGNRSMIDIFEDLIQLGMPHHCCIIRGHFSKRMQKLTQKLNIQFIPPNMQYLIR